MKFLNLLNRLKEPSTWAGIAAMGMLFGFPAGILDSVGLIIGGVAGVAAVLLPEGQKNV